MLENLTPNDPTLHPPTESTHYVGVPASKVHFIFLVIVSVLDLLLLKGRRMDIDAAAKSDSKRGFDDSTKCIKPDIKV